MGQRDLQLLLLECRILGTTLKLCHRRGDQKTMKYLGRPSEPTPEETRLRELAAQYHEETEAFDRTVCTGPIRNGSIMPIGPGERAAINRHALAMRKRLGLEVAALGVTEKEWQHAIANFRQNSS